MDFSKIPTLNMNAKMEGVNLTPEDAFVLSRVNGKSPLSEIQKTVGFSAEKIQGIFEKLENAQLIVFQEPIHKSDSVHTDKKITNVIQKRIREKFEQVEKKAYFDILEVPMGASSAEIERAYYKVSKEFHPDRFFKEPLGPFKKMLEEVFNGVQQAFQMLGDVDQRRMYMENLRKPKAFTEDKSKPQHSAPGRSLDKVKVDISSAQGQFDMGEKEENKGNYKAALNFYKMAMMLDGKNKQFKDAFYRLQKELKDNPLKSL